MGMKSIYRKSGAHVSTVKPSCFIPVVNLLEIDCKGCILKDIGTRVAE